jgi:hypothetical protein
MPRSTRRQNLLFPSSRTRWRKGRLGSGWWMQSPLSPGSRQSPAQLPQQCRQCWLANWPISPSCPSGRALSPKAPRPGLSGRVTSCGRASLPAPLARLTSPGLSLPIEG